MRKLVWLSCLSLCFTLLTMLTPVAVAYAEFSAGKVQEINGFEVWAYPSVAGPKANMTVRAIQETVKYFEAQGASLPDQARKLILVGTRDEMAFEIFNHHSGLKRNMAYATQIASNSAGVASSSSIVILADSNRTDTDLFRVTAHELSHWYQHYLGPRTSGKIPQWFREGTANYWAAQAVSLIAPGELMKLRERYGASLRNEKTVPSLAVLSTNTDFQSARLQMNSSDSTYALSFMAVEELVAQAEEKSLVTLYKNLEAGCQAVSCNPSPIFKDAFKTTYGYSLDEFAKKLSDKLKQRGFKADQPTASENYPGKETFESHAALNFNYKGLTSSWGPTFAVKEFDKIAPPPGMNWSGNVNDWMEQAAVYFWQTSTDSLRPQVGALLIRSNRSSGGVWVDIVREVNADSLVAEGMASTGKHRLDTFKISDLSKLNFAGYIYPVRMK